MLAPAPRPRACRGSGQVAVEPDVAERGRAKPLFGLRLGEGDAGSVGSNQECRDAPPPSIGVGDSEDERDIGDGGERDVDLLAGELPSTGHLFGPHGHAVRVATRSGLGDREGADRLPATRRSRMSVRCSSVPNLTSASWKLSICDASANDRPLSRQPRPRPSSFNVVVTTSSPTPPESTGTTDPSSPSAAHCVHASRKNVQWRSLSIMSPGSRASRAQSATCIFTGCRTSRSASTTSCGSGAGVIAGGSFRDRRRTSTRPGNRRCPTNRARDRTRDPGRAARGRRRSTGIGDLPGHQVPAVGRQPATTRLGLVVERAVQDVHAEDQDVAGLERRGQPPVAVPLLHERRVVVEPHQTVAVGVLGEVPGSEFLAAVTVLEHHERALVGRNRSERYPCRQMPVGTSAHVRPVAVEAATLTGPRQSWPTEVVRADRAVEQGADDRDQRRIQDHRFVPGARAQRCGERTQIRSRHARCVAGDAVHDRLTIVDLPQHRVLEQELLSGSEDRRRVEQPPEQDVAVVEECVSQ
jgi:hypothetical protein